jgi:hypothetical protein
VLPPEVGRRRAGRWWVRLLLRRRRRAQPRGRRRRTASAPCPSWNRSILTEIYLCHACSYQEIEDGNGAPGGLEAELGIADVDILEREELSGVDLGSLESELIYQTVVRFVQARRKERAAQGGAPPSAAAAAVSRSCACIGSPCLRHCGHGASIGGIHRHGRGPRCVAIRWGRLHGDRLRAGETSGGHLMIEVPCSPVAGGC